MLPKGMRDLDPQESILQQKVLDVIREVFELYGYSPLETPLVERMEVLKAKFAAGEEADVMKEIFQVEDQGGRDLGLRYDHTVPLCRYVAMNPTVKLPFKRYSIGRVFRDGPIKLGRYREFWQADADVIGVPGVLADCEGIMMAAEVFQKLNLEVVIRMNSREILNAIMSHVGIAESDFTAATIALDKLEKIGADGVQKELHEAGISTEQSQQLLELCQGEGSNQERLNALKNGLGESAALNNMQEIIDHLDGVDVVEFHPGLARGLQYYTGFVYECFLKKSSITSSLIGSGRYDKMIGKFLGGKQEFPAVGLSFGVSVICDALKEKGDELRPSTTRVYVIPVSDQEISYALNVAQQLRKNGVSCDMDMLGRGIGKNFGYADTQGIPYVLVLGEDEVRDKKVSLKNMVDGQQSQMTFEEALEIIQKN